MADSKTSSSSSSSATPASNALDVFGKLFDTVALIAQHQAAAQGEVNTADVAGKAAGDKSAKTSPAEALINLLQLGAPIGAAKGPDLMAAPAAPGSGGGGGGKSSAEGLASIIKLFGGG